MSTIRNIHSSIFSGKPMNSRFDTADSFLHYCKNSNLKISNKRNAIQNKYLLFYQLFDLETTAVKQFNRRLGSVHIQLNVKVANKTYFKRFNSELCLAIVSCIKA